MATIKSKVKSAVTNYAKNVAGGAQIVGQAISNAVKSASSSSQGANVLKATVIPGSLAKASTANLIKVQKDVNTYNTQVAAAKVAAKPVPQALAKISTPSPSLVAASIAASKGGNQGTVMQAYRAAAPKSAGSSSSSSSSAFTSGQPMAAPTSLGSTTQSFGGQAPGSSLAQNRSSTPASNVINAPNVLNSQNTKLAFPEAAAPDYSQYIPTVQEQAVEATKDKESSLKDYLTTLTAEAPNSEDAYRKAQRETQILQKQQVVNDLTGQLNGIVSKGQAKQLAQVGQGRGIPEAIIGGIQAQIGRETAIAALPVQAQLSAAQGNLEMANDNLETLFKIYSDDAKNEYEHSKEVKKVVYEYASEKEKKALEKKDKMEERAYKETLELNDERQAYAKMAFANGQSSLGAKIAKLDYKSPTFKNDLAQLQSKLEDPVKVAQLSKLNAEISKLKRESQVNATNGVNADLTAYASQYSDTGKLPSPSELKLSGLSVGQVTTYAKQIPKQKGAVVSIQTGTKSDSVPAGAQEDFQKLYNITQMTSRLKELDKKRVGGVISGVVGGLFGSEDQGEYLTLRKAIVDEMSRMQSGAALTPEEISTYNDYLPGRFSESFGLGRDSLKKIGSFETAMNQKLQNRLANNGLSIYGYSTVKVGNQIRSVGDVVDIGGVNYRVLPDGTLTDIL